MRRMDRVDRSGVAGAPPGLARRRSAAWCVPLIGIAAAATAQAQSERPTERLPRWEAGLGVAALRLPDYRGADESQNYLLPLPYFVYRGEFLQADRDGLRAQLFDTRRVELDLSLNASVPVNSEDNQVRAGMPDLRTTVEIGPVLKLRLAEDADWTVELRLPVRRALTWRDGVRDVGTVFFPHLSLDRKFALAGRRWNLGALVGAQFADRNYHDYFYSVDPQFATAQRPAYAASGGFGGWQALLSTSVTFDRAWVGAFVRYDRLDGATFEDSPLLRRRSNIAFGVGVSYILARSATLVSWPR